MNECFMPHHTKQLAFEGINTQVQNSVQSTLMQRQGASNFALNGVGLPAAAKYIYFVRNSVM